MVTSVSVRAGLGPAALSPTNGLVILGRKPDVVALAFDDLKAKLGGLVSQEHFDACKAALGSSDSVHMYASSAKMVGLPGKFSRHESPAEPGLVTRHVRSLLSGAAESGSVVVVAPKARLLATVAAVARAFPLFSCKTPKEPKAKSVSVEILTSDGSTLSEAEVALLESAGRSVREAAALVDMPCSMLNTDAMVAEAKLVATELGVKMAVIRGEELKAQGFGGLYSVGHAADFPPSLVVLSHTPANADKTLALVGKGIVYDTGGLSLKGKMAMPGMKRDMGGSAAILMGFRAAVKAGYTGNLYAVLCLAENHISPSATKPDDIITMLSGKTVEVNNTDAEGRLVLGDGVFYAKTVLKADTIMDFATLTGAQATATGSVHAALVSNSEAWESFAVKAGRASGDMTHPLTFAPNIHFDLLASAVADMKNSALGKSEAASSVAGLFIGAQIEFGAGLDWLHVDMAAPVHVGERATGYGPPLILSLLAERLPEDVLGLLA